MSGHCFSLYAEVTERPRLKPLDFADLATDPLEYGALKRRPADKAPCQKRPMGVGDIAAPRKTKSKTKAQKCHYIKVGDISKMPDDELDD